MQKMNLESIQSKISFLEGETLHRKKLHEEEILKLRRVSDELYENIQTYESMIVQKNNVIEDQKKVIIELKESLNVLDNFNNRWDEEERLVKIMK